MTAYALQIGVMQRTQIIQSLAGGTAGVSGLVPFALLSSLPSQFVEV